MPRSGSETETAATSVMYRRFRLRLMIGLLGMSLLAILIVVFSIARTGDVRAETMVAAIGVLMMIIIMSLSAQFALHTYRRLEEKQLLYRALYDSSHAMEEKLSLSERRLRMVTDNIPVVIGYVDHDERVTFANHTYQDLFGIPLDRVVGNRVIDIIGPETYAISKPYIAAALKGEPAKFERKRLLNGVIRHDAVTYIPEIQDGRVLGFFLLVEDITERKQNEEARLLTSLVYDSTSEGMMILEADGAIIDVNPAFSELTGYGLDDVRGKHLSDLSSDRHKPEFFQEIRRSIGRTGQWQGEIWNCYRNGDPYLISIKFNTVFD